jgi:hypothetical protein
MALVEGVQHAEDDEHTEVSSHPKALQGALTNPRCSLT